MREIDGVSAQAIAVQSDPAPGYFWDWVGLCMFCRASLVTPRCPRRLYPQGVGIGQVSASSVRPLVRPLRPVRVHVVRVAPARGSTARVLPFYARGSTARGYWAKGTPCRGPSAWLSVRGRRAVPCTSSRAHGGYFADFAGLSSGRQKYVVYVCTSKGRQKLVV